MRALVPSGDMGRRGRDLSLEQRGEILDELFFEGDRRFPFLWRYATLTFLSTAIATMGMLNNSSAVVIGAMLIAPLMTPILALGGAMMQAWPTRQIESLAILVGGVVLAVATAAGITFLLPGRGLANALPAEVLSRTAPNLLDLGIALAAGAAAGYILMRKEAGAALPGVAVSVALVPPLAALGITMQLGETDLASGALLLFGTNFVAIVLAATLVYAFAGFVAARSHLTRRWFRLDFALVGLLMLAVSVPLIIQSVEAYRELQLQSATQTAVAEWDPQLAVARMNIDAKASPASVQVSVVGPEKPGDADQLAGLIAGSYGRPVDVTLNFILEEVERGSADP
jgi:uncharacterized hydrophobic protein (TIGR00271 family)